MLGIRFYRQKGKRMKFEELKLFILEKIKLSHLYQPVLIKELIENGGKATIRQLAIAFLKNDESQIQYYEKRIREMPVKILSKHGIVNCIDDLIEINVGNLSYEEKAEIKKLCEDKIHEFVAQRGVAIWYNRFLNSERGPDSLSFNEKNE